MWSRNFSVYSIALIPRKPSPNSIVITIHIACVFGGALVCAARTPSAMVNELMIRIAVFSVPRVTSRWWLAS